MRILLNETRKQARKVDGTDQRCRKTQKNYKQYAKTQAIEALKIVSFHLNFIYFISAFIYTNSTKKLLKEYISSFGPNLK